jgi:hypothetical protein
MKTRCNNVKTGRVSHSYVYDILLYILLQHVWAFSKPSAGNKNTERKIINIQHNKMFLFHVT